ncbi:hypothetical protein [Acanthamoeba castellanii mimivirus]|uniref:Uncharacterized protein L910 n=5 Tax=Mimivirus TaxID=315393 RepID=YL910_MIMIV|nr:hypothetical protein MIMI_gp0975 [Acanthamoeba polyphaga mimivirus]Q5UR05.1 RecName: Full=Uncharacterized protein L910 [Acanthamoeba polyphaga mimivirus]AEQ61131.1 hypothetical protein [Acanthamoeba castellanii mamavirus]AHA44909.1 hypothetical protein HIRU_S3 [Hirudovirus strain Sangsue]AHJ40458.1 hypothetical protein [Samba virus]ALR84546.1 hypothetical protein [Niemeyer virus]AMZ03346.1 hypothetical protein [Mimivirus Bombay]EJN40523.1 hypothetical protein lvs_L798 [Acanthamoeba polyph
MSITSITSITNSVDNTNDLKFQDLPTEIYYLIIKHANLDSQNVMKLIKSDARFFFPILGDLFLEMRKSDSSKRLRQSVGAKPFIPQYLRDKKFENEDVDKFKYPIQIKTKISHLYEFNDFSIVRKPTHWEMKVRIPGKVIPSDLLDKFPGNLLNRNPEYSQITKSTKYTVNIIRSYYYTWTSNKKYKINYHEAICEVWEIRDFLHNHKIL